MTDTPQGDLFEEPKYSGQIKPDETCGICHGAGHVPIEGSRQFQQCSCVLLKKAREYLTSHYVDAVWNKTQDISKLREQRHVLFEHATDATFRNLVKTYLLSTGMSFSHETVTAYETVQAFAGGEYSWWDRLTKRDLLIIWLDSDPKNGSYASTIIALIKHRDMSNLPTWVYVPRGLDGRGFDFTYQGETLRPYLRDEFVAVNIGSKGRRAS